MLTYGIAAHRGIKVGAYNSNLGMIAQPFESIPECLQINLGRGFAVRRSGVIQNVVEVLPRLGAQAQLHCAARRSRPAAMISSIVSSVSGDARPSSIAACSLRRACSAC